MLPNKSLNKFVETLLTFYKDEKSLTSLLNKTEDILAFWKTEKQFNEFISNPSVDLKAKKQFLDKFLSHFKCDEYLKNTLWLLIDYKLYLRIEYFFERLKEEIFKNLNIKNVYFCSSMEIISEQKTKLEKQYQKMLPKSKLFYHYSIDPSLVLGIMVKYDDIIHEYSLSSQLKKITSELKKQFLV